MSASDHPDETGRSPLRRREAVFALGAMLGTAAYGARGIGGVARAAGTAAPAEAAAACTLTREVTEGPYWIANGLTRRNITEGQGGTPLWLRLTVQDAATCRPIPRADVEIWHANALGVYSGYSGNVPPSGGGGHATPNNSKRFLRGHQKAGADGLAIFRTIYPGWYRGRTPHIHLKVHVGGQAVHTGQLFFTVAASRAIYRTGAYASHGQPDTVNSEDGIYKSAGGSRAVVPLHRRAAGGYLGSIALNVNA
jgi:protocatechuate 3,4-dioxygenase beta subunit